jgi:hypothetical protein
LQRKTLQSKQENRHSLGSLLGSAFDNLSSQ